MTHTPDIQAIACTLPIAEALPALLNALSTRHEAVLEAPPGAGKTTIVPLALLAEPWLKGQKIVMLEPRRLAAKNAAIRMAQLLGEDVGDTVGYRMRLETCCSAKTRIEVVTEGILTRMLQTDPALEGVGLVIFDEFHERSLEADLALALCLYARDLFRDDLPLKILAMSATLDGAHVSELLGDAPAVRSEGRMYPVTTHYLPKADRYQSLVDHVAQVILQALTDETGSLLVFLPGQGEIHRVGSAIAQLLNAHPALAHEVCVTPLYGDLNLKQQQQAIAPAPAGKRKVVLATAIAETSLTIEGVRVVIDSGQSRLPYFDPNTALTRLHTVRVSQAASEQRRGRAGRTEPGSCYRCWAEHEQASLPRYTPPEMEQADLAPLALQLLQWGVQPNELTWTTLPPAAAYQQALDLIKKLGALDANGTLSQHGENMARMPVHPRLAHMLLQAHRYGLTTPACELAALLGERDLLDERHADIESRLEVLRGTLPVPTSAKGTLQRIRQQQQHYLRVLKTLDTPSNPALPNQASEQVPGLLLAWAYPDRIARQRPGSPLRYQLSNGRGATLSEFDKLQCYEWLVVANLGSRKDQKEEQIYLASPLNPALFNKVLADHIQQEEILGWDNRQQDIIAQRQWRIGRLILKTEALQNLSGEQLQTALLEGIRQQGLACLPWSDDVRQLQARMECLRSLQAELNLCDWPNTTDAYLLDTLEDWLAPYLESIQRFNQLSTLTLSNILLARLTWEQQTQLNQLAPADFTVPTGSHIAIDYRPSPPVLAVKLQELFGLTEPPSVANGKIALLLHLLSPARRPVQVTQDLKHFWANSYHAVKKDLKGRYPKHPWPDDPANATPAKGTKKQELRRQGDGS